MTTKPWRRILGLLIPMLALVAIPAVPATAGGGGHPYFNDQGTLTWYHTLAEAQRAAAAQGKLIFIEYGRLACSNCRKLCNRVLPHPHVRARMANVAVGLVAECDRPEPKVYWLFKRNLHNARMLPFAGFVTPKGRWVTGFAGYASVQTFDTHLAVAERVQRRIALRRADAERIVPDQKALARQVDRRPEPATPARRRQPDVRQPRAPVTPPPAAPQAGGIGCPDGGCDDVTCCPPANCCPGGRCCAPGGPCCEGGSCCAPNCCPPGCEPNGLCIPGIGRIPLPGCSPRCPPTRAPEASVARSGHSEFPPPAPRSTQDGRVLTEAATPVPPAIDIGSPDGGAGAVPALDPNLPKPVVIEKATAPVDLEGAAARGDWGAVLRGTRAARDERGLKLNRQAHAWAHSQLASAVRALREGRYGEARRAVVSVTGSMRGEPEAVDAERGAEAIELMRDIHHLPSDSPLRSAVQKNAYEKMRGTRWAPLFNDCAAPSRALSAR